MRKLKSLTISAASSLFAAGLAVGAFAPHPAHAVVIVLGGGLGQACYEAAYAVSRGLTPDPFVMTGTNVEMRPVQICTAALDSSSELNARDAAGTYVNRGVLLFADGDYRGSLRDFDSAISADDDIGESHANRGAALVAMHRWADSIPSIDKGLALMASEPEKSYYNRAIANEELGNVRGAYFDYLKAAELRPEWQPPRDQLTRFTVRTRTAAGTVATQPGTANLPPASPANRPPVPSAK